MHRYFYLIWLLTGAAVIQASSAELRIGIVGTDSSHCIQFAKLLQGPNSPDHIEGARLVAAFKGGSPDIENSISRVDGYATDLEKNYGVKICNTIDEVAAQVDAIMILSLDGRKHLPQAKETFRFKKPVFVDKPAGGRLAEAIALFRLAKEAGVVAFSASSLRFGPAMARLKATNVGAVQGAFSYGPAQTEPHHPDLFWYGIHSVEALYAVMGVGCQTVVRTSTQNADIVTGIWADGRTGTVRGIRNAPAQYGLILFGSKGVATREPGQSYAPLLHEIVKFFQTGIAPVSPDETIEDLAFMEAADESKRRGGIPVPIAEVMKTAALQSP